ncbi:hypothetical protein A1O1_08623 [Capronia coronata CBS 617.96]|uniref:60S ribosomal subunit assembly/export protein LOC1 n=1 Tax=Capronia coronata CBS 617.96 TaxID=1182541 RepID=W9XJW0_9EURO|nr:uncharacterized protein A1O1_08623 [Capronia coronata CBS 617.96]EXJ80478.1 hypothetical protein A1O1_08623 [Capronia coronata CBS 617.96]
MAPKPPSGGKGSKSTARARKSATAGPSSSSRSKVSKRPPSKQVKTKPGVHSQTQKGAGTAKASKRKQRTYTEEELKLPTLNMITPVGVQKPRGKKKGKVFVDDKESMMTILALVNAEKEGQIESKMIKARQLEEIREARRKEMEKKKEKKQAELEEVKKDLKKGKKRRDAPQEKPADGDRQNGDGRKNGKPKKRVSFA